MHNLATKETVKVVQVAKSTTTPPTDDRVQELVAQNEQLQSLVDKYKTIIDDTVSHYILHYLFSIILLMEFNSIGWDLSSLIRKNSIVQT